MVEKGFQLKMQISHLTEQLHETHKQIADKAEYRDGSKTGHIYTAEMKVTVTQRENVSWDQAKLSQVKQHFGTLFDNYVKIELKPDQKKIKASGIPELEQAFSWAKKISVGAPAVSYELIEDEEAA